MNILTYLDFSTPGSHLVSIVGGPGFGKSALAVSVAHELLSRGVTVYYVDMAEVSSTQALAEKVLEGDEGIVTIHKNITIQRMYKWARQRSHNTLLLLDNCDDMLNKDIKTQEIQKIVKKLLELSEYLKILTTSRQSTMQFSEFKHEWLLLSELESSASCALIKYYSHELTDKQCQEIGDLTGNVPLALKVVGSLLSQPHTPGPDAVIDRLGKSLIPTLSPKELPVDERVNTCISVSYEYLRPEVKKVGHCLANFPGSFSLDAVRVCSVEYNHCLSPVDIADVVHELVQRSLLHTNILSHSSVTHHGRGGDRFLFHRLIKEFLLHVDRTDCISFCVSFITYFAKWSLNVAEQDLTSALALVDQERHNLLYFLQLLQYPNVTGYLGSRSVCRLYDTTLLQYRFTINELYGPTLAMVKYLKVNCKVNTDNCLVTYVSLVIQLATFEYELGGFSTAIEFLKTHYDEVEQLPTGDSKLVSVYIEFFRVLARYYEALEMYEEAKDCHQRILTHTTHISLDCEPTSCSYANIGHAYHALGDSEYAMEYLKLALEKNGLDPMMKTEVLVVLHQIRHNYIKEIENEILFLLNASNVFVYRNFEHMSRIVMLMRNISKSDEADALENKQLAALVESGFTGHKAGAIENAVLLLNSLAAEGKRSGVFVYIAHLTLNIVEEIPQRQDLVLKLWGGIAAAQLSAGNFSLAIDSAESVIKHIHRLNKTDTHASAFSWCCLLVMVGHGNFNCTYQFMTIATINLKTFYCEVLALPRMDYYDYLLDTLLSPGATRSSSTDLILPSSLYHQVEQYVEQTWQSLLKIMVNSGVRTILKCVFRAVLMIGYFIRVYFFIMPCVIILILIFNRYISFYLGLCYTLHVSTYLILFYSLSYLWQLLKSLSFTAITFLYMLRSQI